MNDLFPVEPLPFIPVVGFPFDEIAAEYTSRRPIQSHLLLKQGEMGKAALVSHKIHQAKLFPSLVAFMANEDESNLLYEDRGRWSNDRRPIAYPQKKTLLGGYTACVFVEGPQKFFRTFKPLPRHVSWLEQLIHGPRDCYFTWTHTSPHAVALTHSSTPCHRFSIGRKGRGLCYWEEATYATNGEPDGIQTVAARLNFETEDKDAKSLKATGKSRARLTQRVFWDRRWSHNPDNPIDPTTAIFDKIDEDLFARAKEGFRRHCSPHHASYKACKKDITVQITPDSASAPALDKHRLQVNDLLKDAYRTYITPDLVVWKMVLGKIRWPSWQLLILVEQYLWPQRDSNPEEWRPTRILLRELLRTAVKNGDITKKYSTWLWEEVEKNVAQNDPYWDLMEDSLTIKAESMATV